MSLLESDEDDKIAQIIEFGANMCDDEIFIESNHLNNVINQAKEVLILQMVNIHSENNS